MQRTKEFIRESLCKRRSFMIKKNSCFIDNCVFKERGSRETIPFFFVFFNGYILFKTIESDNKKAPM